MMRLAKNTLAQKQTLADIFDEEDELCLLDVAPVKKNAAPTDRVGALFSEIAAFYKQHGRLPQEGEHASLNEKLLARRLQGILADPLQCDFLHAQDQFGLLTQGANDARESLAAADLEPKEPQAQEPVCVNKSELVTSLADIFADDEDGLLDFDEPDIFSLKYVSAEKKAQPDEKGQRQPCADFVRFEPLFSAFHAGIKKGAFTLERFVHKLKIAQGDFFILNGLVGYVAGVGERLEQYSGYNARLYLVFENGTELYMLYQSLTHGLVRDLEGRKAQLNGQSLQPSLEPQPTGVVYILKTLSLDPALAPYKNNLYKIGFTCGSVEDRIKNAELESTFFEAPVQVVATNQCFDLSAQKLEALAHGFLAARRLNVKLKGKNGQEYSPREWFNVPLTTALAVIKYIVDGSISLYRLDNTTGNVLKK